MLFLKLVRDDALRIGIGIEFCSLGAVYEYDLSNKDYTRFKDYTRLVQIQSCMEGPGNATDMTVLYRDPCYGEDVTCIVRLNCTVLQYDIRLIRMIRKCSGHS